MIEKELCVEYKDKIGKMNFKGNEKGVKIVFEESHQVVNKYCYHIYFDTKEKIKELIDILLIYSNGKFKKENESYNEEYSTYRKEIERTLSICEIIGLKNTLEMHLICYTDQEDDNWIRLTPSKLNRLIGDLYGYLI